MPVAHGGQPLFPGIRHSLLPRERQAEGVWELGWLDGLRHEAHLSLLWCPSGLCLVARCAAHNDVLPRSLSTLRLWDDVVVREICSWDLDSAVLARSLVSQVDVLTRELDGPLLPTNSTEESNDRRHLEFDSD